MVPVPIPLYFLLVPFLFIVSATSFRNDASHYGGRKSEGGIRSLSIFKKVNRGFLDKGLALEKAVANGASSSLKIVLKMARLIFRFTNRSQEKESPSYCFNSQQTLATYSYSLLIRQKGIQRISE